MHLRIENLKISLNQSPTAVMPTNLAYYHIDKDGDIVLTQHFLLKNGSTLEITTDLSKEMFSKFTEYFKKNKGEQ